MRSTPRGRCAEQEVTLPLVAEGAEHRNSEEIHGTYENVPGPGVSPKCYTLGLMKSDKYKKSVFSPRTSDK